MTGRRVRSCGVVGVLVAVVGAALGCGGGAGTDTQPPEKVASASAALISSNPTPPYPFPVNPPVKNVDGAFEYDCSAIAPTQLLPSARAWGYGENYVAFPVTGTDDPQATKYSHSYTYDECTDPTSLNCQLAHDFFGIPNGNGYKYLVAQISRIAYVDPATGRTAYALIESTNNWYLEGIGAVNQGWQYYPWNAGGNGKVPWCMDGTCPAGTAFFDNNSHPPYGQGAVQADWLQLWNLAWTYSWGAPQDGTTPGPHNTPPPNTSQIESTHHQCSFVYVCPGGNACAQNSDCPSGQSCYDDVNDPGMTCWAPCHNTYTLPNGVTAYNPTGLVAQDFFVAAERHDPSCGAGCGR